MPFPAVTVRSPFASRSVVGILVLIALAPQLDAQVGGAAPDTAYGERRLGLMGGVGNTMGWLGASIELYMAHSRLSVVGGWGYVPESDRGPPATVAFAAAARRYTAGPRHRAYVELSLSLLVISETVVAGLGTEVGRHYGPGVSIGYHYTARRGFTLLVGGGVGWAVGLDRVEPILNIGLGHTWRS
jgi:hypothetical protein